MGRVSTIFGSGNVVCLVACRSFCVFFAIITLVTFQLSSSMGMVDYMSLILDIDRYVIRKQMDGNPLPDSYWECIRSVSFNFDMQHTEKMLICVRHNKIVIDCESTCGVKGAVIRTF